MIVITDHSVAKGFVSDVYGKESILYTIDKPNNGVDVNKYYNNLNYNTQEKEFAVKHNIPIEKIRGGTPIDKEGNYKGYTDLNPEHPNYNYLKKSQNENK